MAGTKIRTFLELIKSGESLEAAIAASGVSPATAKIQIRKNGLTVKGVEAAKPKKAKVAKAPKKEVAKEEDETDTEEDVDLDDIA